MKLSNLDNKYKENLPINTINNIQKFFSAKNLQLIERPIIKSEAGTYSINLELLYDNFIILTSNGKGATEEYARASGYAELYERFCIYPYIINNKITFDLYPKDYTFYPSNLELDYYDIMFDRLLPDNNINYRTIFKNCFYDNKLFDIEYYELLNENNKILLSPSMVFTLVGTTGSAAGNTLEEAINQGSCEIFERYTIEQFYSNVPANLISISKNYISSTNQKILENIEHQGYICNIYDLSYTYQLPVVMVSLLNKDTHNLILHFGSSPSFNIALERCLTEIYQNCVSIYTTTTNLVPHEIINKPKLICDSFEYNSFIDRPLILDILFNKSNKTKPNSSYYLDENKNYSNIDITHFINKIIHDKNWIFYYRDFSLDDTIKAIQIVTNYPLTKSHWNLHKAKDGLYKKKFYMVASLISLVNKYLKDEINDSDVYNWCINNINDNSDGEQWFDSAFDIMGYDDLFDLYNHYGYQYNNNLYYLKKILSDNFDVIDNSVITSRYELLSGYHIIYLYKKYLPNIINQEINLILEELGYNIVISDDVTKDSIIGDILLNVFLKPLKEDYNSQKFKDFLELFKKN